MVKAAKATRKQSKKGPTLIVDSLSKVPELEKILKEGKITIVLVYADWCGACTKFKKDLWGPMCKGPAKHNRAAVRDDMVANTSLANTKFNYLPSILVVDENGTPQTFAGPEGPTNAMPTPKTLNDLNRVVNIPVKPLGLPLATAVNEKPIPEYLSPKGESSSQPPEYLSSTIEPLKSPVATPEGAAFVPQKGGALVAQSRLLKFLRGVANGHVPISSLVPAGKHQTRRKRSRRARRAQTIRKKKANRR